MSVIEYMKAQRSKIFIRYACGINAKNSEGEGDISPLRPSEDILAELNALKGLNEEERLNSFSRTCAPSVDGYYV